MPDPSLPLSATLTALRAAAAPSTPSTPLGPFEDSAVSWTTWATLMGFVGLVALALLCAGPVARRIGPAALASTTVRLARVALAFGLLAVPAVLTDLAHGASDAGGYDYPAAWRSLYDGSNEGRLLGIEISLLVAGILVLAPLAVRPIAAGRGRPWLLGAALLAGAIALGTTKFPTDVPTDWGRTTFETLMWLLHLFGAAIWIGGLLGLLALAVPGAVAAGDRSAFWSPAIRRFSVTAMSCVAAIALSGLWLYWEHVDGPTQLLTTMYGRVLGVKILIFGTVLLLGMINQFWLHPRIDALRGLDDAGDDRQLHTMLMRRFPAVVALEALLALTVLFVAPFLHGSARNQAFQQQAASRAGSVTAPLPKIAAKQVSASTWVYGTAETVLVVIVMVGGYRVSGQLAQRRRNSSTPTRATASALPQSN